MHASSRAGTSLIDVVISLGIMALLFGGIYLVYYSLIAAIANVGIHSAATSAITNEIELIRGLPYGDVGTVGGIPAGVIPQVQTVTIGPNTFTLDTTVFNIDDPFDTSPSSSPVADYKLVDITASCALCTNLAPVEITTTVASRNLTAGTNYGSIFINVIDANGIGVPEATVQVVNPSVTPSVDLTDTTNASGVLELIGVATSSQGYQIFASKSGYTSAQTYPVGGAGNPNPLQPNITVATGTVSSVTLAIDHASTLTVSTTDEMCRPLGNEPISIQGTQLIGTVPDVYTFATTTVTNASGSLTMANVPWDIYTVNMTDATEDVAGTIPFSPLTINPGTTQPFQFILEPAANPALLVSVADASTGAGIPNADITISKGAFSASLVTDHASFDESYPGGLTLPLTASGTYATGTTSSFISSVFDVGGTSSTFNAISWAPAPTDEPPLTQAEFQVAANNDDATWNFIGPDGTANTFFTASSTLPASISGDRYFEYEAFLSTQDPNATPVVNDVAVDYTANCVPPAQALFTSLGQGTYAVVVTAPGYTSTTSTAVVGPGFQSTSVSMPEN